MFCSVNDLSHRLTVNTSKDKFCCIVYVKMRPFVKRFILFPQKPLKCRTCFEWHAMSAVLQTFLDISQVQSRWSKLNREYKTRKGRWENAVAVWQRFHKDIKDLTLWINTAEKVIRETKLPTGDLDIDKAKQEQGVRIKFTMINVGANSSYSHLIAKLRANVNPHSVTPCPP